MSRLLRLGVGPVGDIQTVALAGSGGGGASGGLVLLEEHTVSASATLDFTTGISSAYDDYLIRLTSIVGATNNVNLSMQFSTDGGATYSATGYEYVNVNNSTSNAALSSNASASAASVLLFPNLANDQGYGLNGAIDFHDPLNSALKKTVEFQVSGPFQTVARRYMMKGSGFWGTAAAVNACRFAMSAGNVSGIGRLYGYSK